MRSRITILAVLAVAMLVSSSGVAMGSALSTDTNSSSQQYGTAGNEVLAENQGSSGGPTAKAQPARQVDAASTDKLPFSGYAGISVLLIGLALLGGGLVLRRSTRRGPTAA